MNRPWRDPGCAVAIVVGAVGFVLRRAWRKPQGQAPGCGHCDACQRKHGSPGGRQVKERRAGEPAVA